MRGLPVGCRAGPGRLRRTPLQAHRNQPVTIDRTIESRVLGALMRAVILLECLLVLALAGLILSPTIPFGPSAAAADSLVFPAARFLADAKPGESALYTVDRGSASIEFRVERSDFG